MLQGREKLCYGNRLRAGCVFEEITHFWSTLAMNQYHNTLCWCLLCRDLKKFKVYQNQCNSATQAWETSTEIIIQLNKCDKKSAAATTATKQTPVLGENCRCKSYPGSCTIHTSQSLKHSTLQDSTGSLSCLKYQHFCEPLKSELNPSSYSVPLTASFSQNELQIFCTLSEGGKNKEKKVYIHLMHQLFMSSVTSCPYSNENLLFNLNSQQHFQILVAASLMPKDQADFGSQWETSLHCK